MVIIAASLQINVDTFIALTRQSNCEFTVESFNSWQKNNTNKPPTMFVYIRANPEILFKSTITGENPPTAEEIHLFHNKNEDYFINKKTMPPIFQNIKILVLNGNTSFESDFSQFYTHLFSIKKNYTEIKNKALGKSALPKKHHNCKC